MGPVRSMCNFEFGSDTTTIETTPMTNTSSRRAFLQRASMLSLAGGATPWALNLAALGETAAATATDYKALVCVFLQGGNDHANTVVPYDAVSHAAYAGMRPALAYARSALAPTVLVPTVPRRTRWNMPWRPSWPRYGRWSPASSWPCC